MQYIHYYFSSLFLSCVSHMIAMLVCLGFYCFPTFIFFKIFCKKNACHLVSSANSGWNAVAIRFSWATPTTTGSFLCGKSISRKNFYLRAVNRHNCWSSDEHSMNLILSYPQDTHCTGASSLIPPWSVLFSWMQKSFSLTSTLFWRGRVVFFSRAPKSCILTTKYK